LRQRWPLISLLACAGTIIILRDSSAVVRLPSGIVGLKAIGGLAGPEMIRAFSMLSAAALLFGCQAQNPFAMFGPATVPAPGAQSPSPYYPTGAPQGAIAASGSTGTTASKLPSVSGEPSTLAAPSNRFVADPTDKQAIRIVENPAAAARLATAPRADATTQAPVNLIAPPTASAGAPLDRAHAR
jgi:hypothetical protein